MTPRFPRACAVALTVGLILLLRAVPARAQQNIGSLFFLNSAYDSVAVGYVDRQGIFRGTYGSGNWAGYTPSSGSTKVINTANGFLVYEPGSGSGLIVRVSPEGQPAKAKKYWFSPGWDHIVGNGTFLLFYKSNGAAAIGHITPDGSFVQTQGWGPGSFGSWTHVVATDNNVVFYDHATGLTGVGYISFQGYWVHQTFSYPMWHCDTLTGIGRYFLCYNRVNGLMGVIDVQQNGYPAPTDMDVISADYSHVVRHGSRGVVFYSNSSGTAQFAHIDENGLYVPTHSTSILMDLFHYAVTADSVTSTGDDVLFYNAQFGATIVGKVDHDGQFQQTQSMVLAPWWSDIVATAAR